jgi:hypothetical protein
MATITFSISGSAVVTGTRSYTISDADIQRLLNAIKTFLNLAPASTNAQILLAWAGWVRGRTIDLIKGVETQSAVSGVAPIAMS